MAEMCGAGLHEMTGDNQYRDGAGRKMGCRACHYARGKRRDDGWCRNWHERTEENTYIDERGKRHCKECPSWPAYEARLQKQGARSVVKLSEKELRNLRASVPCVVCGQIPREHTVTMTQKDKTTGEDVEVTKIVIKIPHWPGCPVPLNREGTDAKKPCSRAHRDQTRESSRPSTPCARCGVAVPQPWPNRTVKYCSNSCKSYASRARRRTLDTPTRAT